MARRSERDLHLRRYQVVVEAITHFHIVVRAQLDVAVRGVAIADTGAVDQRILLDSIANDLDGAALQNRRGRRLIVLGIITKATLKIIPKPFS